ADAGIIGLERPVGQGGPEPAHGRIEALGARRLDAVILGVDELEVRPEAGDAAEVAPIVRAERAWNGRRIDEARERRLGALERKIAALAEVKRRDAPRRKVRDRSRAGLGAEARGDDEKARAEARRLGPARAHREALAGPRRAFERGPERDRPALGFDLAFKRQ